MIGGKTGCGLQYAVKRSGSAVGYCALSIRCGTRDESTGGPEGKSFHSGIAHFTEHTIFKGTEKKSASVINGYLDRLGGELNAYTTKEEIVLHATVLKEDLRKAASLLFELATSPTFPEDEIATEKGVVIDEINSYRDAPAEEIYDMFEEMLFSGHPLSSPILGTASSVKKIKSSELRQFVKEKFVPQDMAFTIVADIEEQKMARLAEELSGKFFSNGERQAENSSVHAFQAPCRQVDVPVNHFDKTIGRRSHQANCVIGGLAPSLYEERERLATVLLCNILGGPANNSILNSVLREKNGWVYGIECSYTQYADTGIVAICLGCDKENIEKCMNAIDRELYKIQETAMSPGRLKAAKKQLLGQLAISSDNGETQCLSMGKSLLAYGHVSSGAQNKEKIEAITSDDIQEMARKLFSKERLSRLTFI